MTRVRFAPGWWLAWVALAAQTVCAADLPVQVLTLSDAPLPDAVVYAVPSTPLAHGPLAPAIIDQVDKQFVPRVSVLRAGTAVRFPNSDNIRHSVYSFSPAKVFQLKLYAGRAAAPVVFDKPGVVVLGCNIHDQMVAWVLVIDTPYVARTDAFGSARLKDLAAGDYTLRVWHSPMQSEQNGEALHVDAAPLAPRTVKLELAATPGDAVPAMAGMSP
jgi:plastocyanin